MTCFLGRWALTVGRKITQKLFHGMKSSSKHYESSKYLYEIPKKYIYMLIDMNNIEEYNKAIFEFYFL